MRKKQTTVEDILKTPPSSACERCWDKKHGIYANQVISLYLGPDQPSKELCSVSVCYKCGHIKTYQTKDGRLWYLYRFNGEVYDFNYKFWKEFKNIDIMRFVQLLMDNPSRSWFPPEEIPYKPVVGHRSEFYEPQRAKEDSLPF